MFDSSGFTYSLYLLLRFNYKNYFRIFSVKLSPITQKEKFHKFGNVPIQLLGTRHDNQIQIPVVYEPGSFDNPLENFDYYVPGEYTKKNPSKPQSRDDPPGIVINS